MQAGGVMRRSKMGVLVAASLLLAGCGEDWLADLTGLDMYIVQFSPSVTDSVAEANEISDIFGVEPTYIYRHLFNGFAMPMTPRMAERVQRQRHVEEVILDPNRPQLPDIPSDELPMPDNPNDPPRDPPRDLEPLLGDNEVPSALARVGGPYLTTPDDPCHIAVFDTGIDASHRELNVVAELDLVARSGGTPAPGSDPHSHGTHVAGTIAASVTGDGVAGMAPGFPLHAIRVLNENGSGRVSDTIAGLEYVVENPEICVVNMSLGGRADLSRRHPRQDVMEELERRGVVIVTSAGNDGSDTASYAPAGYGLGLVVSAYDASDGTDKGFASFSNFGDAVHVTAPGVRVRSTMPGGGHGRKSGTSMSAPIVAGAAAVFLTLNPEASVEDVRRAMLSTGETGYSGQTGASGRHPEPMLNAPAFWARAPR
ncbi:MAG: hypothetical protein EA397_14985 [Deltaproteobacteria bacterium]|nr:MAG: hypothetical protein EA397_14985 [Deltaproteobacteria bacterium]